MTICNKQCDRYNGAMAKLQTKITVTQAKLKRYVALCKMAEELDALTKEIKVALLANSDVEEGNLLAFLKMHKGKRTPAWKDICIKKLGEQFVQQIIDNTQPGEPTYSLEVIPKGKNVIG